MLGENRFDFAEFDAEAAQFHLMVETTEVFEGAVGAEADAIASFVKKGIGSRE